MIRLPQLLLLVDDLYSRVVLGEIALSDVLIDATEELLARVDPAMGAPAADCSEEDAVALAAQLRAAFADHAGNEPAGGRLVAGVHLPAELTAVLSSENIAAFEQGVAAGLVPYAILLFLEHEPAIAERLIGWLTGEVRSVANRTVLMGSESWFEFLVLSPQASTQLAATLLMYDLAKNASAASAALPTTRMVSRCSIRGAPRSLRLPSRRGRRAARPHRPM